MRLRIAGDGRPWGARHVKEINLLAGADASSEVHSISIEGDFGQNGPMWSTFVGGLFMEGDLLGSILPNEDISGAVTIKGDLLANINADSIGGNVIVDGTGPHTGSINIDQTFSRTMRIDGPLSGDLTFGSSLSGSVTVEGNMSGKIDVAGTFSGTIDINGDVPDGTQNWIRIRHMVGGRFECDDLQLRTQNGGSSMIVGHGIDPSQFANTTHSGSINILGELSGRVFFRGKSAANIDVGTINAAEDFNAGGTSQRRGGLETTTGFTSVSDITIGTFWFGRIGFYQHLDAAHNPDALRGAISVTGAMLSNAEIGTTQIETAFPVLPLDVLADVTVAGTLTGDIYEYPPYVGGHFRRRSFEWRGSDNRHGQFEPRQHLRQPDRGRQHERDDRGG